MREMTGNVLLMPLCVTAREGVTYRLFSGNRVMSMFHRRFFSSGTGKDLAPYPEGQKCGGSKDLCVPPVGAAKEMTDVTSSPKGTPIL